MCGKGTTAAAATSLVRHALRGAALGGARPKEALEIAHQALRNEALEERFCSAVLAELSSAHAGHEAEIALADAGHPPALLLRPDGS